MGARSEVCVSGLVMTVNRRKNGEGVRAAKEVDADRGIPRLALTKAEAAEALGVSVDFLEEHVIPELRVVRRGRRRLIPLRELRRWVDESAELLLPGQ